MIRALLTTLLLLAAIGCNNQAAQVNPFAMYGPQRLPPPGTQSYGQPATTAPYYQGPAANTAPSLPAGQPGVGQPPAQFNPPPGSVPSGTYQQGGQWRGVSQQNASGVVPASYTEEVSTSASSTTTTTGSPASDGSNTSTHNDSSLNLQGMLVNDLTQVPAASVPLSPPPSASAPAATGWSSMATPAAPSQQVQQPSRIP